MAQRVMVVLEDDLDGTAADQTVAFSLDGTGYEIDLSDEHADQLRAAMTPWTTSARRIGGRKPGGRPGKAVGRNRTGPARTEKEQLYTIRAWAHDHGHPVSDRGRISAAVRDAFDQAHPTR